jgi:hypothetical protein
VPERTVFGFPRLSFFFDFSDQTKIKIHRENRNSAKHQPLTAGTNPEYPGTRPE